MVTAALAPYPAGPRRVLQVAAGVPLMGRRQTVRPCGVAEPRAGVIALSARRCAAWASQARSVRALRHRCQPNSWGPRDHPLPDDLWTASIVCSPKT